MAGEKKTSDMLARRHWVFDLDGTLTLPVHDFALIRASLEVPEGVDILHHLATLSAEDARPLHDRLHSIELDLITRTEAAPGAHDLIEYLAGRGCNLGILTRNSREIALQTLEHIGLAPYFPRESILGRDEALPKPDPDGIRQLARFWEKATGALVMVGDYLYDLQAGQAAGAATIHVHGPGVSRWPEWTDLCVISLEELAGRVRAAYCPTP